MQAPKRIHLVGEHGRQVEANAGSGLYPGMLLLENSSGEFIPHNVAGGHAERLYAAEDALQGRPITTQYATGERVTALLHLPGDVVYAWLDAGETVQKGDFLASAGNGALQTATSTNARLAKAEEDLDLSDSGDAMARIRVRVL